MELSEPCEVLVNRALHPESSFDPPDGYTIYDHTIANHVNYGAKIRLPDDRQVWPHYIHFDHDFVDHKHYVMGRRDKTSLYTDTVGWTLEAAPFVGPALAYPDNTNLKPFAFAHSSSDAIDLALGALDDPGLLVDVDRHRTLLAKEAALCVREKELTKAWFHWRNDLTPVRQQLIAAQARTCLHPYIANQVPLPSNEHHPEGITIVDALLLHHCIPHFHLPMPWLAGEERLTVSRWICTNGAQFHVSEAPTLSTH